MFENVGHVKSANSVINHGVGKCSLRNYRWTDQVCRGASSDRQPPLSRMNAAFDILRCTSGTLGTLMFIFGGSLGVG